MPNNVPKHELETLRSKFDVSRETIEKLEIYVGLLTKWQRAINLVSKTTIDELWTRHILDSAQIVQFLQESDHKVADFGSGAGLPGIIASIMLNCPIDLVESDQRKAAFMREAIRATQCPATVHNLRIEDYRNNTLDVVTARALASTLKLLELAVPKLRTGGRIVALKGRNAEEELTLAREKWTFDAELVPSITASDAYIVIIRNVTTQDLR